MSKLPLFVHSSLDEYPLSCEEFRVYAHIVRRAGSRGAWPSVASIAGKCRLAVETVRSCLLHLVAYGFLSFEDRARQGLTNRYHPNEANAWKTAAEAQALQATWRHEGQVKRDQKKAQKALPDGEGAPKRGEGRDSQMAPAGDSHTGGAEGSPFKGSPLESSPGGEESVQKSLPADALTTTSSLALPKTANSSADAPQVSVSPQGSSPASQEAVASQRPSVVDVAAGGAAAVRALLGRELGGAARLDLLLSEAPGRMKKGDRLRWLEIPYDRVATLIEQGYRDTGTGTNRTKIIRRLDVEVGAVIAGLVSSPSALEQDNVQANGAACRLTKPLVFDEPTVPEAGKFKAGATYRRKSDDQVVQLVGTERVRNRHGEGEAWVLSDGSKVAGYELVMKYEFLKYS